MASRLQPLGTPAHGDFDLDALIERALDAKRETGLGGEAVSLGDLGRASQHFSGAQRRALAAAGVRGEVAPRERFHGAFAGGFSAGYFGTVGSEQGWTPQQFHSNRNRREIRQQQRIADFADEEDLETLRASRALLDFEGGGFQRETVGLEAPPPGKRAALAAPSQALLDRAVGALQDISFNRIGAQLFDCLGGRQLLRGRPDLCPDDGAFQSLVCRPRAKEANTSQSVPRAVGSRQSDGEMAAEQTQDGGASPEEPDAKRRRVLGPRLPAGFIPGREEDEEDNRLHPLPRFISNVTATSLLSLLRALREVRVDYSGLGDETGDAPLMLGAAEEPAAARAGRLASRSGPSAVENSSLIAGALALLHDSGTDGDMTVLGRRRGVPGGDVVAADYAETTDVVPGGRPELDHTRVGMETRAKKTVGVFGKKGKGLRREILGRNRLAMADDEFYDEDFAEEFEEPEEETHEDSWKQKSALPRAPAAVEQRTLRQQMESRMAMIRAKQRCLPGYVRPVNRGLRESFRWLGLRTAISVEAPAGFRATRVLSSPGAGAEAPALRPPAPKHEKLWMTAPDDMQERLKSAFTSRFASASATAALEPPEGKLEVEPSQAEQPEREQPEKPVPTERIMFTPRRFCKRWLPSNQLCRKLNMIYLDANKRFVDNSQDMRQEMIRYFTALNQNEQYKELSSFRLPQIFINFSMGR